MDGIVGPKTSHALVYPLTYRPQDPTVATRIEVNIYRTVRVLVYYMNHQLTLISHFSSVGGYYLLGRRHPLRVHPDRLVPGPGVH